MAGTECGASNQHIKQVRLVGCQWGSCIAACEVFRSSVLLIQRMVTVQFVPPPHKEFWLIDNRLQTGALQQ